MAVQHDVVPAYPTTPYIEQFNKRMGDQAFRDERPVQMEASAASEVKHIEEQKKRLGAYVSAVVESARRIPAHNFIEYRDLLKVTLAELNVNSTAIVTEAQKRTALLVIRRIVSERIDQSEALVPSREELLAVITDFEKKLAAGPLQRHQ